MMKTRTIAVLLLLLGSLAAGLYVRAEDSTVVNFSYNKQRINEKQVLLLLQVKVKPGYKLFALQKKEEDVLFSTITFDSAATKHLSGTVIEKGTKKTELDAATQANVEYFADSVVWQQKINAAATDSFLVKGNINYLFAKADEYIPGEESFKFYIKPEQTVAAITTAGEGSVANKSLLWIFLAAFGGGLLALLTPCVYSMIPVTVSFFTKRSKTKAEGIRNALYYAASIVVIFTLLGFLVTLIFGPAALNNLATNWIANLVFFALFLVFGFSFLGAFEITLPSSWTNKSDSKASTTSFLGIFMALTLVLVSFSCTGPIIGNLLVLASKGSYFGPLVGMLGFSTALALPFALFAFFPSKLNVLGKAGGWLNAVKVTLGFLELALALKFLSNADLVKGWRLLDREIFITLWIVIFALLGIYLLGKLKFHHDDELPKNDFGLPYLTVTRLMFAITAFAFAVYMIPGLFGAPLKSISAFVPPMGTQDFVMGAGMHTSAASSSNTSNDQPHPSKYYEQMKMYEPEVVTKYGMVTYFDYDEALAVAKKLKKPLMLDFTGINCVNCRKMEGQVWSDAEVMKRLKEDFVIVSLYVDVQNIDLPESDIYFSKALNKQVETLGDKNADLQVTSYGANSQPYYFFLDANEKRIVPDGYGYDPDIQKFKQLLDAVKEKYAAGNK
jgi:thiol:disulfide interchange protein DsbD